MPTPYRVSLIDPKNDHELFETDCNREKENMEFAWKREYPTEFIGPIRMQLMGANGLILQQNPLETENTSGAPAKHREAGATA